MTPADITAHLEKLPMPYACCECGASGVKLWRQYQIIMVLSLVRLKCKACSMVEQAEALEKLGGAPTGDQIGWRVPAVPTDDGTFWGYTSVPEPAAHWWRDLPDAREDVG